MAHVQLAGNTVVAVFANAQSSEGYAEVAENDARLIEFQMRATIPQEVTMRQARQQLIKTGKLAAVNAALAGMAGEAGELARAEWEYSTVVQRNRPLVLTLGSALGIDLDAMFIAAAAL